MAGFLFKKPKQELSTRRPTVISAPTTLQPTSSGATPVYAKFATGSQNGTTPTSRLVSSPMPLAQQRSNGVEGRHGYSTSSLTSVDRSRRDLKIQQQQGHLRPMDLPAPRPISQVVLDKPLPPPVPPAEEKPPPPPPVVRQSLSNRTGPPSAFPSQQGPKFGRIDSQENDNKPLPRPGSAQTFYPSSTLSSPAPPAGAPTHLRSRATSINSPYLPINLPIQNGRIHPSKSAQPNGEQSSVFPRVPVQKPYRDETLVVPPPPVPKSGNESVVEGTPLSERMTDLPEGSVVPQKYTETQTQQFDSLNSRRPFPDTKSPERSSYFAAPPPPFQRNKIEPPIFNQGPAPSLSKPQIPQQQQFAPSSPPQIPTATTHTRPMIVNQSSYQNLYPSHLFSNPNTQQLNFSTQRPQTVPSPPGPNPMYYNHQSITPDPRPPLSTGPVTMHPFVTSPPPFGQQQQQQQQPPLDAVDRLQHPLPPVAARHNTPTTAAIAQSTYHRDQPPLLLPSTTTTTNGPDVFSSLRKSSIAHSNSITSLTRGKPRIFAAMEAQEQGLNGVPGSTTTFPGPTFSQMPVQQQDVFSSGPGPGLAPGPISGRTKRLGGPDGVVSSSSSLMQQNFVLQPPTMTTMTTSTSTEEFLTPKADFEPLPEAGGEELGPGVEFSPSASTSSLVKPILGSPPHVPHHHHQQQPHLHPGKLVHSRLTPPIIRHDDSPKQPQPQQLVSPPPQTPPRGKKLSKTNIAHRVTGSFTTTPSSPESGGLQMRIHRTISKSRLTSPPPSQLVVVGNEFGEPVGEDGMVRNPLIPLDDDPFARVEGVKMLKPMLRSKSRENVPSFYTGSVAMDAGGGGSGDFVPVLGRTQHGSPRVMPADVNGHKEKERGREKEKEKERPPPFLLDPSFVKREPPEPATMTRLLLDGQILGCLLDYLTFYEWCIVLSLSKVIRSTIVRTPALREAALERFLKTVGYSRWVWDDPDPLSLSLQDLSDYMRGVSIPSHEYARAAAVYVHSLGLPTTHRDPSIRQTIQRMIASTRAYTRVLLRLRAQAEKEASAPSSSTQGYLSSSTDRAGYLSPPRGAGGTSSRASSRAPSPTTSNSSHPPVGLPGTMQASNSQTNLTFRSPLFRLRRAPLLRVFVPSPEGDWLSDKSVLECEAECKRAGVQHLLRMGDVVWDIAVGDQGNSGRLVWDGNYLLDLDYTYSVVGDLPKYLSSLAFPPSYFHRVIRTGQNNSNPIAHIDISPWGQEIAMNIQLLQDRVRTESPQGAYHNVMRWVHRSSFQLRPFKTQQQQQAYNYPSKTTNNNRIPIVNTDLFVDSGWYGTIVVETEGTNEALADLQDRCGPGVFPPKNYVKPPSQAQIENRKVFRILRERSRPGEIWIRAVGMKERLL